MGAKAQPTDAREYSESPASTTGRRPMESESGPWIRDMKASGTRYTVRVCWISHGVSENSRAIAWKEGKNVSMENGLTIDKAPSSAANPHCRV